MGSITERCSDFCGDLPFFALWSGGNRKCQCFAQCNNHNFRIGERVRNLQNVVYERRLQWTVGEWSDCSVSCGDGIELHSEFAQGHHAQNRTLILVSGAQHNFALRVVSSTEDLMSRWRNAKSIACRSWAIVVA